MTPDWLIRASIALGLCLLGAALYVLVKRITLKRAETIGRQLADFIPGIKTIVYFTTPECVPCRTVQRPALARLQKKLGEDLKIIEINAYENPDTARAWGVLSVPMTFLLDRVGAPRQINYGVTPFEKLLDQIQHI
jgi:thiol-disulfide isomerase/thioredoxin